MPEENIGFGTPLHVPPEGNTAAKVE